MTKNESQKSFIDSLNLSRRELVSVAVFVLLAFAARLVALQFQSIVNEDGAHYLLLAEQLLSGNYREGFSTYWSPLYPLLAALASIVVGDLELGARMVSVMSGTLLVIPVYLLTRDFYGKNAARIGACFVIVYPFLIRYSVSVMTEAIYAFLFTSAVLAGWIASSRLSRKSFAITGVLFAACYLLRPEAIGFLGLMVALTVGAYLFQRIPSSKMLHSLAALLLGFAILSTPYLFHLRQQTGRWMISEKMYVHLPTQSPDDSHWKERWLRLSEDGQTTLADRYWGGIRSEDESSGESQPIAGQTFTLSNIVQSLRVLLYELRSLPNIFPLPLILLCGVSFFRTRPSQIEWVKDAYLSVFLASTFLGYALLHMLDVRYLVPLLPLLIPWTAKGVVDLSFRLALLARKVWRPEVPAASAARPLVGIITTCVVVYLFALALLPYTPAQRLRFQALEFKPVIAWIREQGVTSPRIMATGPIIPFYVHGEHIYLPDEDFPTTLDYARRKNIRYIVIEERGVNRVKNKPLQFLLKVENQPPPGLNLVYENDEMAKHKVVVYELTN